VAVAFVQKFSRNPERCDTHPGLGLRWLTQALNEAGKSNTYIGCVLIAVGIATVVMACIS
jgi:hypothetical protein